MAIDYEALGKRIKDARREKGYTQEQLANATGMSQQHIGNIETAANKLSLQALVDIANALGTTADSLLQDSIDAPVTTYDMKAKQVLDACSASEKESLLHLMEEIKAAFKSNKA